MTLITPLIHTQKLQVANYTSSGSNTFLGILYVVKAILNNVGIGTNREEKPV